MSDNKIKSRWGVAPSKMTRKNIDFLIRSSQRTIKKVVLAFLKRNQGFEYNEAYSIAMVAFYKAVLAYKPEKGSLLKYAECYCWASLMSDAKKRHKLKGIESPYEAEIAEDTSNLPYDDEITLKEIKEGLGDVEYEIIEQHFYGVPIDERLHILGLNTKFQYNNRFEDAMLKAKRIANA